MCMQFTFTFACGHQAETSEDIISQCNRALQNNLPRCSDLEEQHHEMSEECPDCQLEAELDAAIQKSLLYHKDQQRMAGSLGAVETDEDEDEMLRKIQGLSLAEHMRTTQDEEVEEIRRAIEESNRQSMRTPQAMDNWTEKGRTQDLPDVKDNYNEGSLTPTSRTPGVFIGAGPSSSYQRRSTQRDNAAAGPSGARERSTQDHPLQDLPSSYEALGHSDIDFPEERELDRSASAATRARWASMRLAVASTELHDHGHSVPGVPPALDDTEVYEVDGSPSRPPKSYPGRTGVPPSHQGPPAKPGSRSQRRQLAMAPTQSSTPPVKAVQGYGGPCVEPWQAFSRGQGIYVRPARQAREEHCVNTGYDEGTVAEQVIEEDEEDLGQKDDGVDEKAAPLPSPRTMRARRIAVLERRNL